MNSLLVRLGFGNLDTSRVHVGFNDHLVALSQSRSFEHLGRDGDDDAVPGFANSSMCSYHSFVGVQLDASSHMDSWIGWYHRSYVSKTVEWINKSVPTEDFMWGPK